MKESIRTPVVNALKGTLIGAANTIPGVSGGTIAVITRLYDDLIASVGGFFRTGWKRNVRFLLPILLGVAVGIGVVAQGIDYLLVTFPLQTAFFFMGLILGSVPFLMRITLRERFRPIYALPFALTFAILLVMSLVGRPPASEPITELTLASGLLIFGAGVVASATMVVPGISGSFVLLLIGMYSTFIRAVGDLNIPVLAVLLPGFAVGIVLVSKGIGFLLSRFHGVTYWAIIGLVLGSVVAIWPRGDGGTWLLPAGFAGIASGVAAFVVGFVLAYYLGSDRKERHTADSAPARPDEGDEQ